MSYNICISLALSSKEQKAGECEKRKVADEKI